LVETLGGKWRPALCYICPSMEPRRPDPDYVERIIAPARQFGFPDWYVRAWKARALKDLVSAP
jgi:hypothetical protein